MAFHYVRLYFLQKEQMSYPDKIIAESLSNIENVDKNKKYMLSIDAHERLNM